MHVARTLTKLTFMVCLIGGCTPDRQTPVEPSPAIATTPAAATTPTATPSDAKEEEDIAAKTPLQPTLAKEMPNDDPPEPVVVSPGLQGLQRLTTARVSASSTMRGRFQSYAAWRAFDEVPGGPEGFRSGWCEGVEGPGNGEVLTVTFPEPTDVGEIIVAAATVDDLDFSALDAPNTIEIRLDGKGEPIATTLDAQENIRANTSGHLARSLSFTLVTKELYNDTCILDVRFSNRSVMITKKPQIKLPSGLRKTIEAATTAVLKCDPAGLKTLHYPLEIIMSDASDGAGVTSMAEQVSFNSAPTRVAANVKALLPTCHEKFTGEYENDEEDKADFANSWHQAKTLTPYPGPHPGRILVYAGGMQDYDLEPWLLWDCELRRGKWRIRGMHLYGERDPHVPN